MLIYGVNVPEMTAIEFGSILKENPNALIHFKAIDWDWYIIGAYEDKNLGIQSVFCLVSHWKDEKIKSFSLFPFHMIEEDLNGQIDLDFKETPVFDLYLDSDGLPDLYAQENEENPIAHVHLIREGMEGGTWEWFITEGRKEEDGDWLLFGLVNGFEKEIGYVRLSELAEIGAKVDLGFEKIGIYDIYEDFDLRRF